ncbi:uncharacterized protein LY89DRAFT_747791 [Mollisia scopiformis]|uniref:Uncharacterized protein n=1 Tax=Mollisia scopiformis TaxID=149040 RepID=A0A194X919_MOLSC|nr:uncharacterized protein LY89DRAFT_747791 [Mollisia scopiformis]KUJ16665.1 hypothetical protein LY89DRAFT_747791 [Mollisia scopiformis]
MSTNNTPGTNVPTPRIVPFRLALPYDGDPKPFTQLTHEIKWTPSPPQIGTLIEDMAYLPNAKDHDLEEFLRDLLKAKCSVDIGHREESGQCRGRLALDWQCFDHNEEWYEGDIGKDMREIFRRMFRLGLRELVLVIGQLEVMELVKQQDPKSFILVRPDIDGTYAEFEDDCYEWRNFLRKSNMEPWEGEKTFQEVEEGIKRAIAGSESAWRDFCGPEIGRMDHETFYRFYKKWICGKGTEEEALKIAFMELREA